MTEPKITPLARRLAEENGIDWHSLEGTGPDGTIVERDILAFLAKVMAGEVELPPEPADMAPPEAVPDISQVQEVLAREGVDIGELVPEAAPESASGHEPEATAEEVFVEEESFFEVDFDEAVEEPVATPESEAVVGDEPSPAEEGWTVVEPEETGSGPWVEEARLETEAGEPELNWEDAPETVEAAEEPVLDWEASETSEDAAVEEAAEAIEPLEALDFGEEAVEPEAEAVVGFAAEPGDTVEPEPEAQAGTPEDAIPDEEVEPVLAEEAPPPEADEPPPPAEEAAVSEAPTETEPAGFTEEVAAAGEETAGEAVAAAPAVAAVFPPAYRRAVSLNAAEQARADLALAWRREVPFELLLFRAVDRALAELEVPMRPVLGRFDGETARSLAVQPAVALRDLFDHILAAEEEGEGIVVVDLGETPYAEVILPDKVLVALGRAGLPENLGLLSVSGELPTDRTRFLERVAFYLERPILLA